DVQGAESRRFRSCRISVEVVSQSDPHISLGKKQPGDERNNLLVRPQRLVYLAPFGFRPGGDLLTDLQVLFIIGQALFHVATGTRSKHAELHAGRGKKYLPLIVIGVRRDPLLGKLITSFKVRIGLFAVAGFAPKYSHLQVSFTQMAI